MHGCAAAVLFASLACAADDPEHFRDGSLVPPTPVVQIPAPLPAAHCEIDVDGIGTIAMEDDYLPHVIQCENGGANLEALKAQAIAARSVAYYSIETSGGICDGQGCQVYSCGADPAPIHYQAVQETSGQYLNYNGTLTYGFFVAGDSGVAGPGCMGVDANAATEHWVTYNGGRSGTDVEQTQLGYVHDPADAGYGQNRGCMGQWSARCLENDNGQDVTQILQFFYGDDIGITQAPGECVVPLPGDTTTGGGESSGGVADTTGASGPGGGSGGSVSAGEGSDGSVAESSGGAEATGKPDPASETSLGDDGTGGGDPDALPDTFGESSGAPPSSCACSAGQPPPRAAIALVVLAGLLRRRRRAIAAR